MASWGSMLKEGELHLRGLIGEHSEGRPSFPAGRFSRTARRPPARGYLFAAADLKLDGLRLLSLCVPPLRVETSRTRAMRLDSSPKQTSMQRPRRKNRVASFSSFGRGERAALF